MGIGEGEGEIREWTLMDAKGGTPMRTALAVLPGQGRACSRRANGAR